MHLPVPPPPQVAAAGVLSEAAYAQWIFGGEVPVLVRLADAGPGLLGKRSHTHYDKTARKLSNGYLTLYAIPGRRGLRQMGQTQRLHFRGLAAVRWARYDEYFPMYRASAVATADQEWFSARAITEGRAARPPVAVVRTVAELLQEYKLCAEALPRIMQNAKALQKRFAEFSEARKAVDFVNVAVFKEVISPREQIPYRKLLQTQAVCDVMEALGRSS
ncbi:hypothetical protein B0H14DRAFT_3166014 [Mycena olivaceomarginata]|nr:hypothetical protein B0H14DRAFT_3166014 [Mycena olivaceomarginata]